MTTGSFVLRLLPDRLPLGEVVGEVRRVGDDEALFVRDVGELVTFLLGASAPVREDAADREPE